MILLLLACEPEPCAIPDDTLGQPTAWEQDVVLPVPPDVDRIEAEDGLELAFRDHVPAGWDGTGIVVLFVPGSSAHSGLYSAIGQGLADRDVVARLIDVRGHGLSVTEDRDPADDGAYWPGRLGDSADADQIVRDLGLHVATLRAAWPEATVVVGGHSSGAGVVSRWVEGGGGATADGFVLLAPYNHPDQPQVRPEVQLDCEDIAGTAYARVDLGALGAALRGDVHRYVLSFHKPAAYTDELDVLRYTWTTTQGMAARSPSDFWAGYLRPTLVVAASEDHLLDPDITAEEAARADATFVVMQDHSHVGLSWSDQVAELVADWVGEIGD